MKIKTIILSIIFFILIGLLIGIYTGIIRIPFFMRSSENSISSSVVQKNLIKRPTNNTYTTAIKEGDFYFEQGSYQEALQSYSEASELEISKLEPFLKIGEAYLGIRDANKALETFQYVLNKDPQNQQAKIGLAKTYVKKSEFQSALELLLTLSPENQEVRYYIGLLRLLNMDLDKSLYNLQKAVEMNGQTSIAKKAQNTINNIQEFNLFMDGKTAHLQTLIARSYIQNSEYDLAIYLLKNVLKDNNQYRDARILLGFSYYMTEKYNLALEMFEKAYNLDPEKVETQYFLGITYMKMDNAEKASTFLFLALKNGFVPRSDVQKKLADLYISIKKYDEALSTYLDIIQEKEVNDITMYIRPLWIYIDIKKEPVKALELAKQAYQRYPNMAMSYNLLGWAYLANDNLGEAEKNLEEAKKLDPNMQVVYLNFGDLYVKKGEAEKAKDFYQRTYFMNKTTSVGTLAATKYNELVK